MKSLEILDTTRDRRERETPHKAYINVRVWANIFLAISLRASRWKFLTRFRIVCSHLWYANRRRCSQRYRTAIPLNFKCAQPDVTQPPSCSLLTGSSASSVAVHLEKKQRAYVTFTSTPLLWIYSHVHLHVATYTAHYAVHQWFNLELYG